MSVRTKNCIHFLIHEKGYPKSLINVEKELKVNNLRKRYDIVIFNPDGSMKGILEYSEKVENKQLLLQ